MPTDPGDWNHASSNEGPSRTISCNSREVNCDDNYVNAALEETYDATVPFGSDLGKLMLYAANNQPPTNL